MEETNEKTDCIFCKMVRGEVGCDRVYEDDNFFAVKDINPDVEGHLLIISKKHFDTILDLPASLGNELIEAVKDVAFGLVKKTGSEGFNFVVNCKPAAGQLVPHFHMHVLPRKGNDGVKLKVVGGLKDKKSNG